VYTPKEDEVEGRVARALGHALQVARMRKEFPMLGKLIFLVPRKHDCGNTAAALRSRFALLAETSNVLVLEADGHHSCGVLNAGVLEAEKCGSTHATIISGKAMGYFTPEVWTKIEEVFDAYPDLGAVGVATDELREIVLAGRLQNTFLNWNISRLQEVGLFDSETGVEEMAPLIRMCQKYGRCLGTINQSGGELNIADSETARARHAEVMQTKSARQYAECERLGFEDGFNFLGHHIAIRA
jgi:hypothetical protein